MFARNLALAALTAVFLSSCTAMTETTTSSSAQEEEPAPIHLEFQVYPLNACEEDPSQVKVIHPRGEDILLLHIGGSSLADGTEAALDLSLRAPGACGSTEQCGHFLVRVDPTSANEEASRFRISTRTFEIPLSTLETPLGIHTIELQLCRDNGLPAVSAEGQPILKSLQLELVASEDPSCTPL